MILHDAFLKHTLKLAIAEASTTRSALLECTFDNSLSVKINLTEEKFFRHCYNLNFNQVEKYYNKLLNLYNCMINNALFGKSEDIGIVSLDDKDNLYVEKLPPNQDQSVKTLIDKIHENQKNFKELYDKIMSHKVKNASQKSRCEYE